MLTGTCACTCVCMCLGVCTNPHVRVNMHAPYTPLLICHVPAHAHKYAHAHTCSHTGPCTCPCTCVWTCALADASTCKWASLWAQCVREHSDQDVFGYTDTLALSQDCPMPVTMHRIMREVQQATQMMQGSGGEHRRTKEGAHGNTAGTDANVRPSPWQTH